MDREFDGFFPRVAVVLFEREGEPAIPVSVSSEHGAMAFRGVRPVSENLRCDLPRVWTGESHPGNRRRLVAGNRGHDRIEWTGRHTLSMAQVSQGGLFHLKRFVTGCLDRCDEAGLGQERALVE